MNKFITISFKNGQALELGEKTLGDDKWTVHGHFSELIKAKQKGEPYKGKNVHIETLEINFILYDVKSK